MSMMTRILRLWKADIHGVMDHLEDKELLLKQYLREMEDNLQEKEKRVLHLDNTLSQLNKEMALHQEEIKKLEKDLSLALKKEKDDIARLLIRKQRMQQNHCEQLQRRSVTLLEDREQLNQLVEEQRLQHETLKVKAKTFCRQAEQSKFYGSDPDLGETRDIFFINDDEIELELLRRKETLLESGGAR